MCGLVGVVGPDANQTTYDALSILQHRGQDAAGIATYDNKKFNIRKANGLVREVFEAKHMAKLTGNFAIGHVRYRTAGQADNADEAQPFYVNSPFGLSLAHNGNLINSEELKHELFMSDLRHINTNSDSEILLNVFAYELQIQLMTTRPPHLCRHITPSDIFAAVEGVHRRCIGAYSVVMFIIGYGMVAFKDPYGIRPLVFGFKGEGEPDSTRGCEWMFASESVALHSLGYNDPRDLEPGETILIKEDGQMYSSYHYDQLRTWNDPSPCIFEYVYLARPDSVIDGISVYKSRLRMADKLGQKILQEWPDHDIDVVIPIPDTSRACALPLAQQLGVPYREGFVKNRYIGRTFIMPDQPTRTRSVRQKLNIIDLEFRDKNVLLVDDSIVRGTTSKEIIQMARESGAKKVYFASAAPPVRFQNVYGINMPTTSELIAHGRSEEEVRVAIGADRLFYQTLDDLIEAVREGNPEIKTFDTSCFSGEYITGGVTPDYLQGLK